jgi:membrane protease subunit (stomatin/prohibitin family)
MQTIQRSIEAQAALLWRAPGEPFPINSQLVVGQQESVVAALNGAVLGVMPPGNHWLHPQPFPFLVSAVSGSNVTSELWFVRTSPTRGLPFGGALDVLDIATGELCSPRVMGTYTVSVSDPRRFVAMGGGLNTDQITSWITGIVLKRAKQATEDLDDVLAMLHPDIPQVLAERMRAGTEQLDSNGLSLVEVNVARIIVSDEDRRRLDEAKAEQAQQAAAKRNAQGGVRCPACGAGNPGGQFCTACGHRL